MTSVTGKTRNRSEEKREARRQLIADVAARLFAAKGYDATGMAELCEAVGLGRGALYYYFPSKEHVLIEVQERVINEVLPRAREVVELDVDPPEKLRLLGHVTMAVNDRWPDHVWAMMHEWRSLSEPNAKFFSQRRSEFEDLVVQTLQKGIEGGYFQIDDLRVAKLAWFGMHNYAYQWYRPGGPMSAAALADRFHELFMSGVSAASIDERTTERDRTS